MILISYLVGSVPTAIIYGKITRGIDIRKHGSGNAGATNVFRVFGWKAGLIVMLIDIIKGLIATTLVYRLALGTVSIEPELLQIISGLSAVFGHIWTIFAGFKGGKGVGTGAGMILGIIPYGVLVAILVFVITVFLTRYVSLGSILGSITIPSYLLIQQFVLLQAVSTSLFIFGFSIPVIIIFTHRSNVGRLFKGTENKISFKKQI
jgi:glycerol-3-phosphate acyltransferase PlsY